MVFMRVGVNRRWQLLAAGAAVSAAVSLVPLTASADPAPHEATQASVDQLRSTNGAPGTVAVARTGDSVWSVHSGTSALGGDKAIAPTDQFRIGSLTKPFTATVVLQL